MAFDLLNLIIYITNLPAISTWDITASMRGHRIDVDMAYYLWYLTKVGRCFEEEGLLVPTIFRCAAGEGLGHIISFFVLSDMV